MMKGASIERLLKGVYRLRVGEPESITPVKYKEYPAKEWGSDSPMPFDAGEIEWNADHRGLAVSLPLNEQVFGFGLQLKGLNHTRMKRTLRCEADPPSSNGESHAPVPFYVTTGSYGVLVDTARYATFYCGQAKLAGESIGMGAETYLNWMVTEKQYQEYVDRDTTRMYIEIPHAKGVDLYLFAGESMLEAVEKYNMFSGGGVQPPDWALQMWYRLYVRSNAEEWCSYADKFASEGWPIGVLGLEPGWQTHAYACTYVWDEDRVGDWRGALNHMREKGFKVNLWEHAFVHPDSPIYNAIRPYCGNFETWGGLVPDLSIPEAREIFARQQKTLMADGFKMDECDNSDYNGCWSFPDTARFPSGMDGEQMHQLMGTLYAQTMNLVCPDSYHSCRAAYAFAAPYPYVLYSDLYDHEEFIRGVVNSGFSGLLWAPEVRHANSVRDLIRRMQTALFSHQMLINAWYLRNPPWEQIDMGKNLENEPMENAEEVTRLARELANQRQAMLPYLRDCFRRYREEGRPVFRALVMDWQNDRNTWHIDDEYMVGDRYLFAPLTEKSDTRRVYLPEGRWTLRGKEYLPGWHELTCKLEEYLLFERQAV
ncbi:MAG: glycoside hydrolase family 31 protein [Eubacteriales bacterium]|nr:glycoside hydrolase family 31 protein [Eubacteriales bacterium]